MILLFAQLAFAEDCPQPTTAADLRAGVAEAQAAFVAMDLAAFDAAQVEAARRLRCLGEPLEPADAAAYHGLRALVAFVAEDETDTLAAYRSALAAWSLYTLDPSYAPEGHPLREALAQAKALGPSPEAPLSPPPRLSLWVDGAAAKTAPLERPYTLQAHGRGEAVLHTDWVAAGASAPDWALRPPPQAASTPRGRTVMLVGAGASLGASAGLYGAAWATRATFFDPATPLEELQGVRRTTNGATVGAAVLGATGLALGATAWVIQW